MLLLVPVGLYRLNWFFPALMILVGAHYLPFATLYGMRIFMFLAGILIAAGVVFYGRSLGRAHPHRFLPGSKGGLYGWQHARGGRELVLVEGLFDWATLWQAGLRNVTCALGTSLNATQFRQLCDGAARTVYLAFDSDANGSGQRAARQLAGRLRAHGLKTFPVELADGHDPNSFFVQGGGDAHQFQALLERARS